MLSPLQLEASFFDRVRIEAVEGFDPEAVTHKQAERSTEIGLKLHELPNDNGLWEVILTIAVSGSSEKDSLLGPYDIDLRAYGYFRLALPPDSETEPARAVAVNGGSILYSSAREYLLLATSRGPWDSFALPVVSFADMQVAAGGDETNDAPGAD